ncbi:MAG TPA: ABC transporter ATP-binding protein [Conexibacter sp.]|nr:ABC transporter ATP-binding protein [Conexibacter sp.]
MSVLELRGLTVSYGHGAGAHRAVDAVDLTVPAGEIVGLVGESGSGKSTLGKAAVGLVAPSGGEILLDGEDALRRRRRGERRPIQMVFQDPYSSLNPRMTIGEAIGEGMRGAGGRASRRAEVARLLELVRLDPALAGRLPSDLSGGQRQRIAVARALAARPDVIIADEITSALDVSVQGALLNLVRELQRQLGLSLLFISHNLAVVRYVSDAIAVMRDGRIVEQGPTERLLAHPTDPYTRTLLESVPRFAPVTEVPR